ncbi:hypothetical protein CEP48_06885 [Mergibacter septicus]|uniref:Uncharacterized protein n=1 Tax=Mergibacter septicus TaxID=221402 RepID=A0A8D4J0U1_9PAST|nr:TonB-dependent hemoglobin/transferrin/lactoferrin family receptor [Mergibacter septicus]AWX15919.1 hypothetical protein CEP47_06885 [Mergibacter septicus]QDJ15172.1 hypothetical protein CEP48_06885 [Mergibacter septicus]
MYKHTFHSRFLLNIITFSLLGLALPAMAEDSEKNQETPLNTIQVFGSKKTQPLNYDVTGLAELKKTAEKLQADQVENIRDLTRYDPTIGVNESGGRGTSRGFSMRGVDKERVGITVDGFSSAPILRRYDRKYLHSASTQSSSIGEVEYENLKLVDIRKGSASTETGSGALGGSVSMTTKDTADFFSNDTDKLAGRVKLGYTSKDLRKVSSFALAGREGKFEGFIQYTIRDGHEIKAHGDLYDTGNLVRYYDPNGTGNILESYFKANEVSGSTRKIPNPLDYHSEALLSKFGVHLTPEHYLGLILDHSKQRYFIREMSLPNYHTDQNTPKIFDDQVTDSQIVKYTPTLFYTDKHSNNRIGLEYKFTPVNNTYLDSAIVHLDYRKLKLRSNVARLNCATFPNVNSNCSVVNDVNIYGQRKSVDDALLSENDIKIDFYTNKKMQIMNRNHNVSFFGGTIYSTYMVDDNSHYSLNKVESSQPKPNECTYTTPIDSEKFGKAHYCYKNQNEFYSTGKLKSKNYFVGLSDKFDFNQYLRLSLAGRFDSTRFFANPTEQQKLRGNHNINSSYNNYSYDIGIAIKPIRSFSINYRLSSGFRVPSIIEQIGPFFNTDETVKGFEQGKLKAEQSFNQEIGFNYIAPAFKLSVSYFNTDYKNLIDWAAKPAADRVGDHYAFYNIHNFKTHGIDAKLSLDAYSLWNKLPEGLEYSINVGVNKLKKLYLPSAEFSSFKTYPFDAISPLKVVQVLSYNSSDEKYGFNIIHTYSKGKDPKELISYTRTGGYEAEGARFANIRTRSWFTTDLTGYYRYNKNITVRAGVYNLFNYRYITWESARQTSFSPEARISTNNYSILAAPGRNFLINLEVKF